MDQNRIHSATNVELNSRLSALRCERNDLQAKIDRLQAKLQDQGIPSYLKSLIPYII